MSDTPFGENRRRLRSLTMLRRITLSHGLDSGLVLSFGLIKLVPAWVAPLYAASGWLGCLGFWLLARRQSSRAVCDVNLTLLQTIVAAGVQLAFMVWVPQLTFLFLTLLFIVCGFASLELPSRPALVIWLAIAVAIALILPFERGIEWLPNATGVERLLVCLCFMTTLGRCVLLGNLGRKLWETLSQRNRQLKRTLQTLRERDAQLAANRHNLERANAELHHRATHDALTCLPNRALFADRLGQALARAARTASQAAVLVLDLDRFKLINDTLGHRMGDELLRQIAERLKQAVRPGDTVARAGGDEFLVILTEAQTRAVVVEECERLIAVISAPYCVNGTELHTSPSIGVSLFPANGETGDVLLARADEAMYAAKKRGGNVHQFFEPDMGAFSHDRLQLENDLRVALAQGQLELHYQPKTEVQSGTITSVEALLRWRHPERGLVGPGDFIPLAEESGLILVIGQWVLREACRQASTWRSSGLDSIRIAVNLSPVQFRQPGFLNMIRAALTDHDLPPECLEIEMTEGTVMNDAESSVEILEELSRMGVVVAIDDFGTGYSSMSYLRRFPIDKLKIDRGFISNLTHNPADKSIVQAIISLAHSLRLKVVAEGVETAEQLEQLKRLGCDQYQGFLLSPAVPAPELERLIRSRRASGDDGMSQVDRTYSKLAIQRR
jgi:diguanylate cyclase (GGDEF)-like protein